MDVSVMDIVFVIAILGFGLFVVMNSIKKFMVGNKARNEYLSEKVKQREVVQNSPLWVIIYIGVALLGVVGSFFEVRGPRDWFMFAAYIFLVLYAISFFFEYGVKKMIIFDEDGFFFEHSYYRYRNVNGVEITKGIFKRQEVRFTKDLEPLRLPAKFGTLLKEKIQLYRKRRKLKR